MEYKIFDIDSDSEAYSDDALPLQPADSTQSSETDDSGSVNEKESDMEMDSDEIVENTDMIEAKRQGFRRKRNKCNKRNEAHAHTRRLPTRRQRQRSENKGNSDLKPEGPKFANQKICAETETTHEANDDLTPST